MRPSATNSKLGLGEACPILVGFCKPYRFAIWGVLVLGVVSACLEGIGLGLMVPVLQNLTGEGPVRTGNALLDSLSRPFEGVAVERRVAVMMLVLVGVSVFRGGAVYGQTLLSEWVRLKLMRGLRARVYDQMLKVGYQYIARHRAGDLWNHLTEETNRTSQVVTSLMQQASLIFVAAVGLILILAISSTLTILAIVLMGVLSLLLRVLVKKAEAAGEAISETNAKHISTGLEGLAGMREVRLFGQEAGEMKRFDSAVDAVNRATLRNHVYTCLVPPLSEIFTMVIFAASFLVATRLFEAEAVVPMFLTFLLVLYRLMPRVTQFNSCRIAISSRLQSVRNVLDLLSPEGKPFIVGGNRRFPGLDEDLRFESVSFRYEDTSPYVLRDVELSIRAGESTALVGESGAGKSTLVDLIPRFYDPTRGDILADGTSIKTFDLTSWRAAVGVVSQDTFVFNSTVLENIAYGCPDADLEAVEDAVERANARAFIEDLPEGFNTMVGDRGVRLSGGQRQRLSIARAILKDPQILILDEATSALDTASERLVQEAIEEISRERTVVVIAHRLSTIVNADQIIVLEKGQIVERGAHKDLIALDGSYCRFHRLQFESQNSIA
ncbi:MAG TPA: ABC transporter ATP-binding protein [Candidatus Latescibacteria bacterium]|nr:ABC transporter ATP-binding protein [Candidatus Latescibacterota bacterium]